MWSLGAVLFHILCGSPPFTGRGDDRGAQMLRTIMTTDPDYGFLREEGVSELAVDFVSRLLRTDPHERPNEAELFRHPWIANVPDIDEYSDTDDYALQEDQLAIINEAAEDELDASQLSIVDKADIDETITDRALDETGLKRPRLEDESSLHYPSLPPMDSFSIVDEPRNEHTAPAHRLFGEVASSALRSSAIFGRSTSHALGTTKDQSSGESMEVDINEISAGIYSFPAPKFTSSAVSLLEADSLIDRFKMPRSHKWPSENDTSVEVQPGVETRRSREVTPANPGLSDATQLEQTPNEVTPKALPFHRRIELPPPLPDTASESSIPQSNSFQDQEVDDVVHNEHADELAVTIDARTGFEIVDELPKTTQFGFSASPQVRAIPHEIPQSLIASNFLKPRPLLGKLVTTPGSIFEITLRLEDRMTSWGRGPLATVTHPDPMDTRIPAYAIEVTFWSPGIEARIAQGADWFDISDVMTILSTKTRKCIWVNGVALHRGSQTESGSDTFLFGKIYSGDIITIFDSGKKYLRFQCEIYHGDSARPRPESEKGFVVRKVLQTKSDSNLNLRTIRAHDLGKVYA